MFTCEICASWFSPGGASPPGWKPLFYKGDNLKFNGIIFFKWSILLRILKVSKSE